MNANEHDDATVGLVVVRADGRTFALPSAVVQQITASRAPTPLPFVPHFVDGLVNIDGAVMPQLDLGRRLGGVATAGGEVVVLDAGRSVCALLVQKVLARLEVPAGALSGLTVAEAPSDPTDEDAAPAADDGAGTVDAGLVDAQFSWEGSTVLVLVPDRIGELVCAEPARGSRGGLIGRAERRGSETASATTLSCLTTRLGAERFAFRLDDVVEVVEMPSLSAIPGAPSEVAGIAVVRDEPLLVLSLARLLGATADPDATHEVVVIERDGVRYGLQLDGVEGISHYPLTALRRIDDATAEVSGVFVNDALALGFLEPTRLISAARHAVLARCAPARAATVATAAERRLQVLQVTIRDDHMVIPIDHVSRIVEYRAPEPVTGDADGVVVGAVEVLGAILPAIDVGGTATADRRPDGSLVILRAAEREWALLVSAATRIVDLPESALEAIDDDTRQFTCGVARHEGRLYSLFDAKALAALRIG